MHFAIFRRFIRYLKEINISDSTLARTIFRGWKRLGFLRQAQVPNTSKGARRSPDPTTVQLG
jgi:hypothetical protein